MLGHETVAAVPLNAPLKTIPKAAGTSVMFIRMITNPPPRYRMAMNGTSTDVNSPIRLMPPRITMPVSAISTTAVSRGSMPNDSVSDAATELACTMLPMPKAASEVSMAKMAPSHGSPSPFFSVYIAPPRIVPDSSGSR